VSNRGDARAVDRYAAILQPTLSTDLRQDDYHEFPDNIMEHCSRGETETTPMFMAVPPPVTMFECVPDALY
jgi:hypothetical protein